MKKYTVVLRRPEYMGPDYNDDDDSIYVAIGVRASGTSAALKLAQAEVFAADKKDKLKPKAPEDYSLIVMFEGAHQPVLYSFQVRR
jgi:hypothetical protein